MQVRLYQKVVSIFVYLIYERNEKKIYILETKIIFRFDVLYVEKWFNINNIIFRWL